MKAEFTAIVKRDGDWWLGWVEEIPGANAQEKTREELILSLKEAVKDILDPSLKLFKAFMVDYSKRTSSMRVGEE